MILSPSLLAGADIRSPRRTHALPRGPRDSPQARRTGVTLAGSSSSSSFCR